jgi:homoserine O-succinyltransferase
MTLVTDQKLPSLQKLQETLPADRFVAAEGNERALNIGVLNLMPTAVCERTEMQFMRLFANARHPVRPVFMYFDRHKSNSNQAHFDEYYKKIADIKESGLDALIITGANLEEVAFEDVLYWKEFVEFIDWAREHIPVVIFSCWAMHAALYHFYGIIPTKHEKKQFGIFEHVVHHESSSPLLIGMDDKVFIPHSRWRGVETKDIQAHKELEILIDNAEVGSHLIVGKGGREIYVQGHPEYDRDDIAGEYFRDKQKGIAINPPKNYFPDNDDTKTAIKSWGANGQIFYENLIDRLASEAAKK